MNRHLVSWVLAVAAVGVALSENTAPAQEPGWLPVIVADGELREQLNATPIGRRPYRPFHFYGNTIRRSYHRGNPLPQFSDVRRTISAAVGRSIRYG